MESDSADVGGDMVSKAVCISSLIGVPIILAIASGVDGKSGIEGTADKSARSTAERELVLFTERNDRRLSDGDGIGGGIVDVTDIGLDTRTPLIVPISASVSGSRPFITRNGVGSTAGLLLLDPISRRKEGRGRSSRSRSFGRSG